MPGVQQESLLVQVLHGLIGVLPAKQGCCCLARVLHGVLPSSAGEALKMALTMNWLQVAESATAMTYYVADVDEVLSL